MGAGRGAEGGGRDRADKRKVAVAPGRWRFFPAGEREQLVLFDHGERGGKADQEVRAAILESAYGRGLYYASDASHGREIGFYDGKAVQGSS